jgi:proton-dependent oligopeptide transporter, POT family
MSSAASTTAPATGHPPGLYVLFATEMWERFNFYGMRALLTLFLVNALRFQEKEASLVYGCFLGLCYLTPIMGGLVSDRFLGNRMCIMLGGLIMACGQFLLFYSGNVYQSNVDMARNVMWIALGFLIIGNGLFKPNISSMVGQLYPKGDARLDSAFTIFYMGINVGAFLGLTICPLLGDVKIDEVRIVTAFRWGFVAAGVAMLISVVVFYFLKDKYLVDPSGRPVGDRPSASTASSAAQEGQSSFSTASILSGIAGWVVMLGVFYWINFDLDTGITESLDIAALINSFIFATGLALAAMILTDTSLTKIERDRILVLYVVAFFVMFFWACFEQAGSSLTFVADNQTDRKVLGWDMPPSLVQNFNAFFIIVLAPVFGFLWLFLQRRNLEPISPVKQAIGLGLLALGFLIMAYRVNGMGNDDRMWVGWLVAMYLMHTVGELCLSPVGLSLVSKLAPIRFSSLLMGVWFLANAGGYALAGILGTLLPATGDKFSKAAELGLDLQAILDGKVTPAAEQIALLRDNTIPFKYPEFLGFQIHNLYDFFMVLFLMPAAAAVVLFLLSFVLRRMMHGVK